MCSNTADSEKVLKEIVQKCAAFKVSTIHCLVSRGFDELAALFLQRKPCALHEMTHMNMTVLHIAILQKSSKALKVLESMLLNNFDSDRIEYVNRLDDLARSALSYAITASFANGLDAVLRMGADPNHRDRIGSSPLMDACYIGCEDIVETLVENGADVSMRDNFGLSAFEHLMSGESQRKNYLLELLAPHAGQWQLNKALWHAFQSSKQFLTVLITLGADPEYVGLPVNYAVVDGSISGCGDEDSRLMPSAVQAQGGSACQTVSAEPEPPIGLRTESGDAPPPIRLHNLLYGGNHYRIDACCRIGVGHRFIIRLGPASACKYVLNNLSAASTDNLQNVSDPTTRLSSLLYIDSQGDRRRKYGKANIQGIGGVAVRSSQGSTLRRSPAIYVKLKWAGITESDALMCNNGFNWTTRSDFISLVGQKMADSSIRQAWIIQERRYANWRGGGFEPA